jgi:hypothetical protein
MHDENKTNFSNQNMKSFSKFKFPWKWPNVWQVYESSSIHNARHCKIPKYGKQTSLNFHKNEHICNNQMQHLPYKL